MVKNAPGTPLPWTNVATGSAIVRDAIGREWVALCRSREALKDAVYLTHAANAYPKLVEALRKVLETSAFHRSLLSKHGFDQTPVEYDASALLRELGEEA